MVQLTDNMMERPGALPSILLLLLESAWLSERRLLQLYYDYTASNSSQLCSQTGVTLRPICVLSATGEDATEPADLSKISLAHESSRLNPDGSLKLDDNSSS